MKGQWAAEPRASICMKNQSNWIRVYALAKLVSIGHFNVDIVQGRTTWAIPSTHVRCASKKTQHFFFFFLYFIVCCATWLWVSLFLKLSSLDHGQKLLQTRSRDQPNLMT